ncbi:adenine deaminase [Hansschlegelia plantiphila]|uniref:Adenine deaminase n=1 Tax=Hansschlegelia plantiphila TaxID=374655 RepID=A0A9W6MVK3_9HYPH|nr:adenine deaminase [Hansschlegelia plantiphila]GLK67825.1 adenine deaminase 1 [Hansschlegelia plantiphila]
MTHLAEGPTAAIARRIEQGRGLEVADLVIKGARVLDVVTATLFESDVAICGDTIVGTFQSYDGVETIDGRGLTVVPGFVDTHLHIESSLLTPLEFDRCVLPHGVTTAIWDPHEIANVLGTAAIDYAIAAAEAAVMDIRVNLSSCVPASPLETSGARLEVDDLTPFRDHPKVIGLAEFMNFPGVLNRDPGCLAKLAAFRDGHIDGHAPLVLGKDLNGYLAAGIRTDHEANNYDEALEKLRKGMSVLIRESSIAKDLHALWPLITPQTSAFIGFCTDDRNPVEIAEEGHLDHMIRWTIAQGAEAAHVYRVASWSGANAFGMRDRGLVAPGKRADLALLSDYEGCRVEKVIAAGRLVTPDLFGARRQPAPVGLDSMKADPVTAADLVLKGRGGPRQVIGVVPGKIVTESLTLDLVERGGVVPADTSKDALSVAVVARHGVNRNIGRGFVKGFGLRGGAIASSVGHDSHNICVVGADASDMAVAVNRVIALGGGFVVTADGAVTAELALPLAGLMSLDPHETVRLKLVALRTAAKALGCVLPEPFLQVAFLPLSVIPHLKITDFGMVDVDRFEVLAV